MNWKTGIVWAFAGICIGGTTSYWISKLDSMHSVYNKLESLENIITEEKISMRDSYNDVEKEFNKLLKDSAILFRPEVITVEIEDTKHKALYEELKIIVNTFEAKPVIKSALHMPSLKKMIKALLLEAEEPNPNDFTEMIAQVIQSESDGGYTTRQFGGGPARGIIQMEPETEKWLLTHYLKKHPKLNELILKVKGEDIGEITQLEGNLLYQIYMCYALLKSRLPNGTPPDKEDKVAIAVAIKDLYNTKYGSATVSGIYLKNNGL